MNGSLNKYYFIASIVIHVLVAFGISYMIHRDAMTNKNVVVLGAHSRYSTKALYKRGQSVPFVQGKRTSGKLSGKPGKKKIGKNKVAASRSKKAQPLVKKSKVPMSKKNKAVASKKSAALQRKAAVRNQALDHEMPLPTAMVAEKIASKPTTAKKLKKQKLKRVLPVAMPDVEEEIASPAVVQPEPEIVEPVKEQEEAAVVANDAAEHIPEPEQPQEASDDSDDEDGDGGGYYHVGQPDAVDLVARYHQRVLSQEVTRLWTPPVGVRKGTECIASITFTPSGSVKALEFVKRSTIPIYDLSILRLKLVKFDLPPDFRFNKPLIIVFHQ